MIETKNKVVASHRAIGLTGGDDASQFNQSKQWFERAKKVLAGGISSSARATTTGDLKFPQYIARGSGSRVWDLDGHEFIDYLLSYGSVILGHGDSGFIEALTNQIQSGTMFGTCNTVEVELAEQICKMVPCAELVRYANSGSEAILGALRAARGFTGKSKILKFEGHYHGWVDALAVSNRPSEKDSGPLDSPNSSPHSPGIPASGVKEVIICPWNEPEILKQILDAHRDEFAAIICEPIVANNACTMPADGFLQLLRDECTKRKIVLIFDEIVTGFRLAPGGAQEFFNIEPDLAVYSKAIGGGLPISAFAGKHAIMDLIGANTVKHGGTYNGNPLCAAAALHTLNILADSSVQQRMREFGETLMESIRRSAKDNRVGCIVQGAGSMFQVIFGLDRPPKHYRDLHQADTKRYAAFRHELLKRGIHSNSTGTACWFLSAAHDANDLAISTDAIESAMRELK